MSMMTTRVGPVEVHESGSGPPLVLLHAAGHDHHDYDAVIPALAARHRVLAVDWPGAHGSRSTMPAAASTVSYAEVLEDLAPEGAVICGSSIGGHAAVRLAVARPERVRGVILVDSGGFGGLGVASRLFCRVKGTLWVTARIEGAFARHHLKRRTPIVRERLRRIEAARRDPAGRG